MKSNVVGKGRCDVEKKCIFANRFVGSLLTFPLFCRVGTALTEQTSIQCLLHWRFTLNDNGIIRGNGTWGAEEDERLRKLAPVFSSPSTGPRYAPFSCYVCYVLSTGMVCTLLLNGATSAVRPKSVHRVPDCDGAALLCSV